jgi:hypothetical protein
MPVALRHFLQPTRLDRNFLHSRAARAVYRDCFNAWINRRILMNDTRVWEFEESLWISTPEHYRESIDDECLMVLPEPPFVMSGQQAIDAVSNTPRWSKVVFSKQQIKRPQEGLIVIAYHVEARRDEEKKAYEAHCTSTYRRLEHEVWRVVQHQQTPPLIKPA